MVELQVSMADDHETRKRERQERRLREMAEAEAEAQRKMEQLKKESSMSANDDYEARRREREARRAVCQLGQRMCVLTDCATGVLWSQEYVHDQHRRLWRFEKLWRQQA